MEEYQKYEEKKNNVVSSEKHSPVKFNKKILKNVSIYSTNQTPGRLDYVNNSSSNLSPS
jgi:hypothetical protein